MEKSIFLPTQRYEVPSVQMGKRFVDNLAVDLDIIRNRHWNTERVIVFQSVILYPDCLVSSTRNICDQITSCFYLWNKVVYDKLVQYYYGVVEAFLGHKRGTQTQEQHYCTFSDLILRGKFCESVRFICERETGVIFLPNKQASDSPVFMDKTVAGVLAVKHPSDRKTNCSTL